MITSPNADVSAAIDQVNRQFEQAMRRSDAEGLLSVYTALGSIMPPNSPIIKGSHEIRAFWQGAIDMGIKAVELKTVELDDLGDTVNEVGLFKLMLGDGSVTDEGKYVVIWKKEDGNWRWHHDIWSSKNPAA